MNAHQRRLQQRWVKRALIRFADGMGDSRKYAANKDFQRLVKILSTGHEK